jgi:hypothetical protein
MLRSRLNFWRRMAGTAVAAAIAAATPAAAIEPGGSPIAAFLQETHWGETDAALLRQYGALATRLPWRLDYGDAYTDVVLRDEPVGGFRFIVYFQMEKRTGGLLRIQIERPRHGANPPAFRAAIAALAAAFGDADRQCAFPPRPAGGYQAAVERVWQRGDAVIRAIFRDTTLEASEGCFDLTAGGPCGLEAQLLVRLSPHDRDAGGCRK